MASFFKRGAKSRTSSYTDEDYEKPAIPERGGGGYDAQQPPSSYRSSGNVSQGAQQNQDQVSNNTSAGGTNGNYSNNAASSGSTANPRSDSAYVNMRTTSSSNNVNRGSSHDSYVNVDVNPNAPIKQFTAPDLLTLAFNEAIRPHTEKIEHLERQLVEMQLYVDQLEQHRLDMHNWIDKRGLRPDVPPTIAQHMDAMPAAAPALNAQLDRKITIVNFDLHRLQDDLNDSISSAHFAAAMEKFLPDIRRLAALPSGPRHAFELVVKLVGNLNSHGGLEASAPSAPRHGGNPERRNDDHDEEDDDTAGPSARAIDEDRRARQAFYERMDAELAAVVARRSAEGEDWPVSREVKRLEKNAAYLKSLGIEPYFPRALDVMRHEAQYRDVGGSPGQGGRY